MRKEIVTETIGRKTGYNSRGYWLSWICPACKYKANDSIVCTTGNIEEHYKKRCDKCDTVITITNN